MIPDETAKRWAIELRDTAIHKMHYVIIDLINNSSFKQDLFIENAWWTGITAFCKNKLVMHRFQDSENPETKDFYVLDLETKKISWQSAGTVFVKLHGNKIYGYEKTAERSQVYKIISLEDHAKESIDPIQFDQKIRQITETQEKNKAISYPFYYPEDHTYFATVVAFLKQFLDIPPVKGCEYLEHQNAIIISYYIDKGNSLENHLLVMNRSQDVLLHDKIGSRLQGIGTDTFFVVKNRLIFIKEKRQLVSYVLDNV